MKPLTAETLARLDAVDQQQAACRPPLRPVLRWCIDCTSGRPVAQWCLVPDPAEVLADAVRGPDRV